MKVTYWVGIGITVVLSALSAVATYYQQLQQYYPVVGIPYTHMAEPGLMLFIGTMIMILL